eukprot:1982088-Amphidinium_carterae.3
MATKVSKKGNTNFKRNSNLSSNLNERLVRERVKASTGIQGKVGKLRSRIARIRLKRFMPSESDICQNVECATTFDANADRRLSDLGKPQRA